MSRLELFVEDDCIPEPSSFDYCTAMLDRYSTYTRIGHLGGFSCQEGQRRGDGFNYFSRYYCVWGWATWRRAWNFYDVEMGDFDEFLKQDVLKSHLPDPDVRLIWQNAFCVVSEGRIDTWDCQ